MLYTRFVIGEETLSSTSVFNFCHCAIFSRLINRSFCVLILGIVGSVIKRLPLNRKNHRRRPQIARKPCKCWPSGYFARAGSVVKVCATGMRMPRAPS